MTYKNKYPYYRKNSYKKNYISKSEQEAQAVAGVIVLCLFGIYAFYLKYMKEHLEIINYYVKITFYIVLVLAIIYIAYQIYKYLQFRKKEKQRIENIPLFLRELEEKIKTYVPIMHHKEEKTYQMELVGHLREKYPELAIEVTRDFSRPDIIINDIAIEIKGPTDMQALKTLPDKINSYIPKWKYLFIVLYSIHIIDDSRKNKEIYFSKKSEILENTIDSKRDKIFFIEHFK